MSEAEQPKKRRFWQLHLSTAVFLMLAAGLTLGTNIGHHKVGEPLDSGDNNRVCVESWGWPSYCVGRILWENQRGEIVGVSPIETVFDWDYPFLLLHLGVNGCLIFDIVVALLILIVVAFASEWLIRRREGRKP